jgi:hypothetical protein
VVNPAADTVDGMIPSSDPIPEFNLPEFDTSRKWCLVLCRPLDQWPFGASQGGGSVQVGGVAWPVQSWSDNTVVADVPGGAMTGSARILQNVVPGNGKHFTVTSGGGGGGMILAPDSISMVVGATSPIQALNSSNQPVTGLTWTSSNPNIVSLSAADPPTLTALAVGTVTITAGTASANVTVTPDTPAIGAVLWSNPGDGSGVASIVPAVPSATGVADVFAFQNDGNVQAITSDGITAWTANVSLAQGRNGRGHPACRAVIDYLSI